MGRKMAYSDQYMSITGSKAQRNGVTRINNSASEVEDQGAGKWHYLDQQMSITASEVQ